jgi:HEAT repeat protein
MATDQITPEFIQALNGLLKPLYDVYSGRLQPLDSRADLAAVGRVIALRFNDDEDIYPPLAEPFLQLDGPVIPALVAILDKPEAGYYLTRLLVIAGARAVEPLLLALESPNADVRYLAVQTLGQISDYRAGEPLIRALADPDWRMRSFAAEALGMMRYMEALLPLLKTLHDEHEAVTYNAAMALGRLGPKAMPSLVTELSHADSRIRSVVARVLGTTWSQDKAFDSLKTALDDPEMGVRAAAAHSLGILGNPRAVDPLLAALHDPDEPVVTSAIIALGLLRDARAVEPLIAALNDPREGIRQHAASSLSSLPHNESKRSVTPLILALRDIDSSVRTMAAYSLIGMMQPEAIEPLIEALNDHTGYVRQYAAEALGQVFDERSVDVLIKLLADPDVHMRATAASALGELASPRAIPALIALLAEPEKGAKPRMGLIDYDVPVELPSFANVITGAARIALQKIATPETLAAVEAWEQQNANKG